MRTHVALLRGINVAGQNKVSMPQLRALVEELGHLDVTTYIQSGNVIFTALPASTDRLRMADDIEEAIAGRLGIRPAVIVVSRADLADVIDHVPFSHESDPRRLHAVFMREAPDTAGVAAVGAAVERARAKGSRDDARLVGRTLYLWTPDGFGRSLLRAELSRQGRLQSPMHDGTARNWVTVTTLLSLLDQ
jgi:uncharacterized protein (DUF1697 family)